MITSIMPTSFVVQLKKMTIQGMMKDLVSNKILFSAIEIETINKCNGKCAFCPVNSNNDTRLFGKMDEDVFRKVIDELESLHYSGFLGLQSNNEPLLDKNIYTRMTYARQKCPEAFIYMYTNGTLLNTEKLIQLVDAGLDEMIINNYNDNMVLNINIQRILSEIENPDYEKYRNKIKVSLRKETEILTNRGGAAPNKRPDVYKDYINYSNAGCLLPFRQIVIRPTGEISLCCQDALGQVTLGDARKQDLKEIWFGPLFSKVRQELISNGRKGLKLCNQCDVAAVYASDLKELIQLKIKNIFRKS